MRSTLLSNMIGATAFVGVLLLSGPTSLAQQAPAVETTSGQDKLATVGGQVLRAGTNEPLRKARVVLTNENDHTADPYVAITDAEGRFTIAAITPARYGMWAERDGYVPASYGEEKSGGSSSILLLQAGQKITDLLFRLKRFAAIAGRVIDEDGEPAQNVVVEAIARRSSRREGIDIAAQATTNDLGEYRIFDLRPGNYYVRASPARNGWSIIGRARLDNSTLTSAGGYVLIYYPNVSEISRASLIQLKAGDQTSGVDFMLQRIHSFRIRGQVSNAAVDNPKGRVSVGVVPSGAESISFQGARQGEVNESTGEFEIDDVPSGSYTVFASYQDKQERFQNSTPIVVADSDVDSVRIVITRGAELHGRVTWEGTPVSSGNVSLYLEPNDLPTLADGRAELSSDGTFSIKGLPDGLYEIVTYSKCQTCYLKSATANGVDVLYTGLQISVGSAPSPLELTFSSNSATVDGVVVRDDNTPVPGATVVLVADRQRLGRNPDMCTASTDQYGHFVIKGVAPGSYHAEARKEIEDDDYTDTEFLKQFELRAQALSIAEREKKTLSLTLHTASSESQ
jgi:Carboxypeptidase regulatory-like domain